MHVQMRVKISGTRDGVDWPEKGTIIDLPDDEARALIVAGLAKEATDADLTSAPDTPSDSDTSADPSPDDAAGEDSDDPATGDTPGELTKEQLLALAAEQGIEVDGRWGIVRLREALGL